MESGLQITMAERDGALVVGVCQRLLDAEACNGLLPAVVAVVKARELPVVMDLAQVEFLPSLAIGMLVRLQKELRKLGQPLVLAGVNEPLKELLWRINLQRVIPFTETVKQAVAGIGHSKGTARPPLEWKAWADKQISIQLGGENPE